MLCGFGCLLSIIHLITQDTHSLEALIQSSWQNAPHDWHITMAFKEQAQLFASGVVVAFGLLLLLTQPPPSLLCCGGVCG